MALLTNLFAIDEDFIIDARFNGELTSVYVTDLKSGVHATGHAKHFFEDTYNQDVGYELAHARAMSRLWDKLTRKAIKATK